MAVEKSRSAPPGFPAALAASLREDACVRADASQLRLKLEQTRAAAGQVREGTALPGRLLAALGRRKGLPTPEEATEIFARENVLQRQCKESERLQQHYTAQVDLQLAVFLQDAAPVYRQQSQARVRLAEWERLITDLRTDLGELLKALGQARNNAVAGYDRKTNLMCATARELFEQARSLIRRVDEGVRQANGKAAELSGLPGVAIVPLEETIDNLTKLEISIMLRDFDRLALELELFEQKQLVDLLEPAVADADALVAKSRAYLANYREQLRAYYDTQITPEETTQAIPGILERYRRG
jgi:uncharacterized coiled-coil protein SlyX